MSTVKNTNTTSSDQYIIQHKPSLTEKIGLPILKTTSVLSFSTSLYLSGLTLLKTFYLANPMYLERFIEYGILIGITFIAGVILHTTHKRLKGKQLRLALIGLLLNKLQLSITETAVALNIDLSKAETLIRQLQHKGLLTPIATPAGNVAYTLSDSKNIASVYTSF